MEAGNHGMPAAEPVRRKVPKTERKVSPAAPYTLGAGTFPTDGPPSLARGLPAHEQAVIDAALLILARRVREPAAVFTSPHLVREYLRLHLGRCERERFAVLFLDSQHGVIAFEVLFEGTLAQASVYPREVAKRALQLNAGAVVLVHNHPSGDGTPSAADEYLTRSLSAALLLIDVRVIDHFVIGWPDVVSFSERGLALDGPPAFQATPATPLRKASRRRGSGPLVVQL